MQKGLGEQACQPAACVPLAVVQNIPYTISINTPVSSGASQHKPQQMLDAVISSFLSICYFFFFFFPFSLLTTCLCTNHKCLKKKPMVNLFSFWSLYCCPKLTGQEKAGDKDLIHCLIS